MSKPKIKIIGTLPKSPERDWWLEACVLAKFGWPPELAPPSDPPEVPPKLNWMGEDVNRAKRDSALETWSSEVDKRREALHTNPTFIAAASDFLVRQREEPQQILIEHRVLREVFFQTVWAYRNKNCRTVRDTRRGRSNSSHKAPRSAGRTELRTHAARDRCRRKHGEA